MSVTRALLVCTLAALPAAGATFGTVVPHTAPLSDLVLDENRKQIYVLNSTVTPPKVEIYNAALKQPNFVLGTSSIQVDRLPTAMAMDPTGTYLYVVCYQDAALDIIDLNKRAKVNSVNLPANPEAVAVGVDGTVLISTIGTSTGQSVLLTYNPNASTSSAALQSVVVAPAAPTIPATVTPGVALYLEPHARLAASADGKTIIGVHEQASTRVVFVYDVASQTVLRSRTLTGLSPILAVSADGSRFISGQTLIESKSMAVLAQQSAANTPFLVTPTANFTTQTNQGGAVFTRDGSELFTAYNIVPVLNPTAQTNTSQLWVNTPDSMLVSLGVQLPETLSGKLVITSDGGTIYAISQSGFIVLTVGTVRSSPLAMPDSNVALLLNDQCGVTAAQNSAVVPVRNVGAGAMTVSAQVNSTATSSSSTASTVTTANKSYGGDVTARFSSNAARTLGTSPPDQLLIQSSQAVNVIPSIRVFQNNRNAEAAGTILPVDIGGVNPTGGTATGLTDMLEDTARQRLYISNAGMNRIEIFDMQQKKFLTPVSVGQLPRAMALAPDGNTLYVANGGGEYLSVVDLTKMAVSGTVELPPQPFNSTFPVITPQFVASSQRGPQVVMSNGTLWKIVNGVLTPRILNPLVFGAATTVATQSMTSTPEGAYVLLLATSGVAYLYSAADDDFEQEQQVVTAPITGYFGPVAAGPNGLYYAINGQLYNSSLTLISNNGGTGPVSGGGGILPIPQPTLTTRPVSAVAAVGAQSYAQFSTPLRASATAAVTDAGMIQIIDVTSQKTTATINALEGPLQQVTGAARVSANGRTMVFDGAGTTAYVLTESGLSILPVPSNSAATPVFSAGSVTNAANYQAHIAPGALIAIFGRNLAAAGTAAGTPLPNLLGGTCVTFNNAPVPLLASSAGQINAQVPTTLAAGNYPVVIRSIANNAASSSVTIPVAKYAPAVFMDSVGPAIFHANGDRVDQNHPATRDEPLTIYATGLGVTTGGRVTTGMPAPASPLAVTMPLQVFFGDPTISDSGVIVDWSGLVPGFIGLYQINCRVPGTHLRGNGLAVTLRIGGINSPVTGLNVPLVYVN